MKKMIFAVALTMLFSGCAVAPFRPPISAVSFVRAPLSTEGNFDAGTKKGESSSICILGLVSVGDCSVDAAVKNGGLKKICHLDYGYLNIIGIYQKTTVIAHGE